MSFNRLESFDVVAHDRAQYARIGEKHLNEVEIVDNINTRCNNIQVPVYLAKIVIGLGVLGPAVLNLFSLKQAGVVAKFTNLNYPDPNPNGHNTHPWLF
jgi:hypothetical protein